MLMAYIQNMLGMFQSNPAGNWRMKDTAINMVIALAVRAGVTNKGASQVNEKIPVMQFAETYLYPGLNRHARPTRRAYSSQAPSSFLTTFSGTRCPRITSQAAACPRKSCGVQQLRRAHLLQLQSRDSSPLRTAAQAGMASPTSTPSSRRSSQTYSPPWSVPAILRTSIS